MFNNLYNLSHKIYLYFFEKKYTQNLHMFKKITNVGRRLVM